MFKLPGVGWFNPPTVFSTPNTLSNYVLGWSAIYYNTIYITIFVEF